MNKIILSLLLSIVPVYFKDINAQCKLKSLSCQINQQCNSDIKQLQARSLAFDYQRLFVGNGNGKRTVIKQYVQETNALLIERHMLEIVNEYKKEGFEYYKKNLFQNAIALAEKENKDLIILYITNIDEVPSSYKSDQKLQRDTSMFEHRAALAALQNEWEKFHNNNNNHVKIFLVYSASSLDDIPATFKNRVKGLTIQFKNPEFLQRAIIFDHFLFQYDSEIKIVDQMNGFSEKANELYKILLNQKNELNESNKKLDNLQVKFWHEYDTNFKSWFTQQSYLNTQIELIEFCKKQAKKCADFIAIIELERSKANSEANKNNNMIKENDIVGRFALDYLALLERRYKNLAFKYQNPELFIRLYQKTEAIYNCKSIEIIARLILQAAITQNQGEFNKMMFENFLKRIKEHDPVGDAMLTVLLVNKGIQDLRKELQF